MRTRRRLLAALGALAIHPTVFSQKRIARIGLLLSETMGDHASRVASLRAGLSERGYIEGENFDFLIRSAEGKYDGLPALSAELAKLNVDVLVAFGSKAARAAQGATKTIPIVVPLIGDPVALGLAKSLSRPGSNLTGHAVLGAQVSAKQVELLKEAAPGFRRLAHLYNAANVGSGTLKAIGDTCERLKVEMRRYEVRSPADFAGAFVTMSKQRVDAVSLSGDTLFRVHAPELAAFAAKHRLPTSGVPEYADAGCLLGYGAVDAEMYRHSAYFIDRILKGAKPADLPIEQPTKFELAINKRTAKQLGISIPRSVLLRADRVIE